MANRSYRDRDRFDYERYDRPRQEEQFESDYGWRDTERGQRQMGEGWRETDYGAYDTDEPYGGREFGRGGRERWRSTEPARRSYYAPAHREHRSRETAGFASFTGSDQAGRDFSQARYSYGPGSAPHETYRGDYGESGYGLSPRETYGTRGERDERGFFERAGDEVASWFGDEEAARRREMDYRGRGPSGYTRSDERILEDACDALTDDWRVDARQVQVTVKDGEITLDGTVPSRDQKRRAEDCVEDLSGVRHVQNNLRVEQQGTAWDRSDRSEPAV